MCAFGFTFLLLFCYCGRFTLDPKLPTERKADPTLNDRALRGEFSTSLVHILKGLFKTLDLSTTSRNLGPVPIRILEDTQMTLNVTGGGPTLFQVWMNTFIMPGKPESAASTGNVVASIMDIASGVQKGMVRSQMVAAGFTENRKTINGVTKRYFVKMFEDPDPTSVVKAFDYTKPHPVALDPHAEMPSMPGLFA